jgi:hypothetical protein
MTATAAACRDCRFAIGDDKSFITGQMECHRFPPALKGTDAFPQVSPSAWCGEFEPGDAAE